MALLAQKKLVRTRDLDLFNIAMLEARNSQCRYMFGALIARGRCILSIAPNVTKSHPKQSNYHEGCITIHAELHAILKCQASTLGTSLYVARFGNSPISKPCSSCLTHILLAGISEVIYCNGKDIVREKL